MFGRFGQFAAVIAFGGALFATAQADDTQTLQAQVMAAERAFAKTMADRNFVAFAGFVSEEAIFFSGPKPLHGRQAVVDGWKRFYDQPKAPFSWEPETVEVLPSGTLALSSGPVRDPAGKRVATFNSIWRLESPGTWRVIFDKGEDVCDCKPGKTP
ncbi:YybH family protein [Chitinimonas naiadis]